jgi:hypothetical protein
MDGFSFVMGFGFCALVVTAAASLFVWRMKRGDERAEVKCTCSHGPRGNIHKGSCRLVEAWAGGKHHNFAEVDLTGTIWAVR